MKFVGFKNSITMTSFADRPRCKLPENKYSRRMKDGLTIAIYFYISPLYFILKYVSNNISLHFYFVLESFKILFCIP